MSLQNLIKLAEDYAGESLLSPIPLKGDGSDRQIYRFYRSDRTSFIGVLHSNREENAFFVYLTHHFSAVSIPVPRIYAEGLEAGCYLLEDLGQSTLAERLAEKDLGKPADRKWIEHAYRQVLHWLPRIQFMGHQNLDYTRCVRERQLDTKAFVKDLQYFKDFFWDCFASNDSVSRDLENELEKLAFRVGAVPLEGFLYRDFQSRNIMWKAERPYFIDYQSGCRGAIHYDLATLLYASRSGLDEKLRTILIDVYLEEIHPWKQPEYAEFVEDFYHFVLIRRLRSLGTYGFLASQKGKRGFVEAIPPTIREIASLLKEQESLNSWGALKNLFERWENDPRLCSVEWLMLSL